MKRSTLRAFGALALFAAATLAAAPAPATQPKVYVAFHWHMHQPIYWPGESITQTAQNPSSTDAVVEYLTWPDRVGAYTHYPIDTIQNHMGQPHVGAQISFSGSLIEDIDDLAAHGIGYGQDWANRYREGRTWKTALGNPRIDLTAFGFHHPLMPLCEYPDVRRQIAEHREKLLAKFGGPASKGIFPPENAFSTRLIPALVDEGIEWALVDNLHFDRANQGYPWTPQQKIEPPNPADARNPAQPHYEALTCQQNSVNMVSTGLGLRPHWAEYIDPATGKAETPEGRPARMIVVPTERSIGYDDSYGDRSPIPRLQQLEAYNTDPAHPFLVVLAHDGDNAGASGSRYYLETTQWIAQNPGKYELITVQDYLQRFPPAADDVIHVEDGSWTGADLGDAEFKKWNGDPYKDGQLDPENGYSPDRNSWAVITATRNRVLTADAIAPGHPGTQKGWRALMEGTTSCYWYWDGTFEWDLKPTIAGNQAAAAVAPVLGARPADTIPPTLYLPQREPYNPGGRPLGALRAAGDADPRPGEWTLASPWTTRYEVEAATSGGEPSDFTVWTLAYDLSGLESVSLRYRVTTGPAAGPENEVYAGGEWAEIPMAAKPIPDASPEVPAAFKADQYSAKVEGLEEVLVDYYVEAVDGQGNLARSPIGHVWVGKKVVVPDVVSPPNPGPGDVITIRSGRPGKLHWGVDGWQLPAEDYWPEGTTPWGDGKAVDTPFVGPTEDGTYQVRLGPLQGAQDVAELNFVFHYADDTWGSDHTVALTPATQVPAALRETLGGFHRAAVRVAYDAGPERPDASSAQARWRAVVDAGRAAVQRDDSGRLGRLVRQLADRAEAPVAQRLRELLD